MSQISVSKFLKTWAIESVSVRDGVDDANLREHILADACEGCSELRACSCKSFKVLERRTMSAVAVSRLSGSCKHISTNCFAS